MVVALSMAKVAGSLLQWKKVSYQGIATDGGTVVPKEEELNDGRPGAGMSEWRWGSLGYI